MQEKELNKSIYNDYYKSVKLFRTTSPGNRWMFDLIEEQLQSVDDSHTKSILDVGCGDGIRTLVLKNALPNSKVLGIDFSSSAIEAAMDNVGGGIDGIHFKCIDAEDLSIWENKYDMITCFEVLEHVEDWESLVDKFASSSNQFILLSFPAGKMKEYEINYGHLRNFKKGQMENYLKKHNFYPVKVFYAGFPFNNLLSLLGNMLYKQYHEKIETVNEPNLITKLYSNVVYFLLKRCSTKYRYGRKFVGLFKKIS